jgi:hypothetical protein
MKTAIIVRKKDNHNAPLITATPETVDLTSFDVLDEHGNPVGEEVLDEIRKLQAPPSPPAHQAAKPAAHHAPPAPTHNPPPAHNAPHAATPHEPPKKK